MCTRPPNEDKERRRSQDHGSTLSDSQSDDNDNELNTVRLLGVLLACVVRVSRTGGSIAAPTVCSDGGART